MIDTQAMFKQANLHEQMADWQQALKVYLELSKREPEQKLFTLKLMRVYRKLGQMDNARIQQQKIQTVRLKPTHFALFCYEAGQLESRVEEYNQAKQYFQKLIELQPAFSEAYSLLGASLQQLGEHSKAIEKFNQALDLGVHNKEEVQCSLASSLSQNHQEEAAKKLFLEVVETKPDAYAAYYGLGMIEQAQGDFEKARANFLKCLSIYPLFAEACQQLCMTKKYQSSQDKDISMLETRLKQFESSHDKTRVHFGLAKAYDDCQHYEQAALHYRRANNYKKQQDNSYDPSRFEDFVDQIIEAFPKQLFDQNLDECPKIGLPLWIIGLPRSGTTLCEQILSSHSKISGAGELPYFAVDLRHQISSFPKIEFEKNREILKSLRQGYLSALEPWSKNKQHVIDKYPANFLYLGVAKLMFPHLKAVHTTRNIMDNCLSIYFQDFVRGNSFSHDMDEIIHYHLQKERLMAHWQLIFPGQIYELNYEQLIDNQRQQTEKLLRFLGLEWQQSCINYHQNERLVTTHSSWQVRQPLYSSSKLRWKHYQKYFKELNNLIHRV